MARSAQSASLSAVPGYRPGVVSSVFTPQAPAMPQLPQVPAIDDARAPNAVARAVLASQLGPLAAQNQARLTGLQAQAKLGLAGYGGWKFGVDDPSTTTREDLNLSFDQNAGPGEREKQAVRDTRAQFAKQGALYSSQANQNIASALQRLSLEAQQVALQYSNSINQEYTGYANQVAGLTNQWASLYGQDAAWLMQNPPPAPPPAPAPAPAPAAPKPAAKPKPQRVIVLGDAEDISPHQASLLAQQGYKIGRAGSGKHRGKFVAVFKG
jgi:hypothetical protein